VGIVVLFVGGAVVRYGEEKIVVLFVGGAVVRYGEEKVGVVGATSDLLPFPEMGKSTVAVGIASQTAIFF